MYTYSNVNNFPCIVFEALKSARVSGTSRRGTKSPQIRPLVREMASLDR